MSESDSGERRGRVAEVGQRLLEQILRVALNGSGPFKGAAEVAEEHLSNAGGDREAALDRLVATHVRLAATSGFVNGAGGILLLPVTVPASVARLYVLGARVAGGIAHLRGYDVKSEEVQSAMLVCLLGSGAAGFVSAAGIEIGQKSLAAALKKLPGRLLIELNKRVGFRLATKAGTTGTINLSKLVPLVGAPIGASVDGLSCRAIAKYSRHAFPSLD